MVIHSNRTVTYSTVNTTCTLAGQSEVKNFNITIIPIKILIKANKLYATDIICHKSNNNYIGK